MTVEAGPLIAAKYIENSETLQFVASSVTIIDAVSITNISASSVTLNLSLVSNAGSAGDINRFIKNRGLLPNETYLCPEILGQVLGTGDFISASASASSALNIRASGRVIT